MTRDQVSQVQDSFKALAPFRDYAATLFYERLFEIDPSTQPFFASVDMRVQGAELMAALGVLVARLRRPDSLLERPGMAAIRHLCCGLQECHFSGIGKALIAMLAELLGHDWTHDLWLAWADAYAIVRRAMTAVARTPA